MKKNAGQIAFSLLMLALIGLLLWLLSLISLKILYIIMGVLILLIMVTIHEFGHYLAGKALKFKINEFAIGFGPKLFSKKRKNGEVFSIRILPLGGFCAFEGEDELSEDKNTPPKQDPFSEYQNPANPTQSSTNTSNGNQISSQTIQNTNGNLSQSANASKAFSQSNVVGVQEPEKNLSKSSKESELKRFDEQAPWKRIVVLFAGGAFNLISAVFFAFLFILVVGYEQPKIDSVYTILGQENAYYNTLQKDDIVLKIDGQEIGIMKSFDDLVRGYNVGDKVVFTVLRDGKQIDELLTKQKIVTVDNEGEEYTFDGFGFIRAQNYNTGDVGYSLKYAVPFTGKLAWAILGSFGDMLTGNIPITEMTGPIGTVDAMAEYTAADWRYIFLLLPLIAANLGLFNLFPIPALDGSKIVFATIEWIRKKPLNRNVEAYIHLAGMAALLLFIIVLDIMSFIL